MEVEADALENNDHEDAESEVDGDQVFVDEEMADAGDPTDNSSEDTRRRQSRREVGDDTSEESKSSSGSEQNDR